MEQTTKFWQGTNFWVAALMAVFGISFGFSESDVSGIVSWAFGGVGIAFAIREKVKGAHIDVKAWLTSKNTWNYVFAAIAAGAPAIPAGLGDKISDIAAAIAGKNWGALLTGVVSLGTIVYFWIFAPKPTPAA